MFHFEVETPLPPSSGSTGFPAGSAAVLAALSRNASVISSSSSSSSSSSLLLTATRPGPLRTFCSPCIRSSSSGSSTPTRASAPLYLSKELFAEKSDDVSGGRRSFNKSRSNSGAGRMGPDDFEFGEVLGEGSYSTVMAAVYPPSRKAYAIKIIDKAPLIRKNMIKIANMEKNVLVRLAGHPGIVRLHWAFQDTWSWYFVLDLLPHGDLQMQLSRLGSLSVPCSRWYTAQMIDTTAWMHSKGVSHRDLKPENILLDSDMRIKISDFGSAKVSEAGKEDDNSNSWVGTPQYVPPELLNTNTMHPSSDFWAIGCILYQMISAKFPFQGNTTYLTWIKVKTLDYTFPDGFDDAARDLVLKLLVLDHTARLGAGEPGTPNDLLALRAHPFFSSLSWDTLWTDPVPPIVPGTLRNEVRSTESDASDAGAESERSADVDIDDGGNDDDDDEDDVEPQINGEPYMVKRAEYSSSESDSERWGGRKTARRTLSRSSPAAGTTPPMELREFRDTTTPSSCDDANPSESPIGGRLGGILESLALSSRSRRPSTTSTSSMSILADPARWMPLLRPSETPVFNSSVIKATKRAFPRQLLPLSGGGSKKGLIMQGSGKVRLLVLTKTRLLCMKEHDGELIVKDEMLIGGQGSGIGVVTGVEKGDQTFVVQTMSKSYMYITDDAALAARWAKEIREALPPSPSGPDTEKKTVLP